MSVLLICNKTRLDRANGRELLSALLRSCLIEVTAGALNVFEIEWTPKPPLATLMGAFRGYIDGLDQSVIASIVEMVRGKHIRQVVIDGSNLGEVAHTLRRQVPGVKIATIFHNLEARFFLGALKSRPTPRALMVFIVNYLAERKSVRSSDRLIALTAHDSKLLARVYGRSADRIFPMALEDKFDGSAVDPIKRPPPYVLFVGGAFYANLLGIRWFIRNVVPRIKIRTVVVGRGMEAIKEGSDLPPTVEVIGEAASLQGWYANASFVVAPIFDGSGMKTKVAEAMMYGKQIVGTPEAFAGYEDVANECGSICRTADEFISVINKISGADLPKFDPRAREIFEQHYSRRVAVGRISEVLRDLAV